MIKLSMLCDNMMLSPSGRNAHKGVHTQEIIGIKYQYLIETIYLQHNYYLIRLVQSEQYSLFIYDSHHRLIEN
jgi:hypothetical protein